MSSLPLRRLTVLLFSISITVTALASIYSLTLARPQASVIVVNPGQSIQAAINSANPGDTIVINAGTYTESLTLSKAVSLTGVSSATVIIKAPTNQRVLAVSGSAVNNSVIISGFTVANGNATGGITWSSCPTACGGGILITGTAQPIIQGLIITGNNASAVGGGLYVNGPLTMRGVVIGNNAVHHGGGGAYIKGTADIIDSRFEINSCVGTIYDCIGGGLMAENMLVVNNSQFVSNTVVGGASGGFGGGAYAGRAMTVTNSILEGNRCTGGSCIGGGLYVSATLTANGTIFKENSATTGGGGGYILEDAKLTNSRFENNSCINSNPVLDCRGGGLMTGGTLTLDNSQVVSNTVVGGDYGGFGGGVYASEAITSTNNLFQNNLCLSHCTGGGLYASTTLYASKTDLISNTATINGGGGYVVESATLINSYFEGNHAFAGGGLMAQAATSIATSFVSNSADDGGGASIGNATLVGGRFENNSSETGGGLSAGPLILTDTKFIGNNAQFSGSAISHLSGDGRIVNALFAGNIGTVLDLTGEHMVILHSTIASPTLGNGMAVNFGGLAMDITDTIIASYTIGIRQYNGIVYEDYNLFFGNTTNIAGIISGGTHDVFDDPHFANPVLGNYHVISPSAAIDAGIAAGVTTDLDGISRPIGAGFDIGAYEYINFTSWIYLPLVRK